MCFSKPKKIADKLADAPAAPEEPPVAPVTAMSDEKKVKRQGRNSLRIDLAAGNTSLGQTGLRI